MKNAEIIKLIKLVKEIDKDLDAYEYSGYSYANYIKDIKDHKPGNNCIRNKILGGQHIWSSIMDTNLNEIKQIINKLWLVDKNKYNITETDINNIRIQNKHLSANIKVFHKNTDKLSLYPIQSERI